MPGYGSDAYGTSPYGGLLQLLGELEFQSIFVAAAMSLIQIVTKASLHVTGVDTPPALGMIQTGAEDDE